MCQLHVNTIVISPIHILSSITLILFMTFLYIFGVAWSPASRTTERHVMVNESLSITKMALAQATVHPKVRQDARMLQAVCQTCTLYYIIFVYVITLYYIYILYCIYILQYIIYINITLLLFLLLLLTLLLLQLLFIIVIVFSDIRYPTLVNKPSFLATHYR